MRGAERHRVDEEIDDIGVAVAQEETAAEVEDDRGRDALERAHLVVGRWSTMVALGRAAFAALSSPDVLSMAHSAAPPPSCRRAVRCRRAAVCRRSLLLCCHRDIAVAL